MILEKIQEMKEEIAELENQYKIRRLQEMREAAFQNLMDMRNVLAMRQN